MNLLRSALISAAAFFCGVRAIVAATGVESPSGDLLRDADGTFLGTSADGGSAGAGTIFRVSPNSEVSILVQLTGDSGTAKGRNPVAGLVRDGAGLFWGTTREGGTAGFGTIFKFDPVAKALTTVAEFDGTNGSYPQCTLASDGAGHFLGTTFSGGANNLGTIFQVDINSGTLTKVVDFTGTTGSFKGSAPAAGLTIAGAGTFVGTTSAGGSGNLGTIFRYASDTVTFTTLAEFTGTSGLVLGSSPSGALVADGLSNFWGTTSQGGSANKGTVFKITSNGTFATLGSFSGSNGSNPTGSLVFDGSGTGWGMTSTGGQNNAGVIFKFSSSSLDYVSSFTGTAGEEKGASPLAGFSLDTSGNLWGTASKGGRENLGAFFYVTPPSGGFHLLAEPNPKPTPPVVNNLPLPPIGTTGLPVAIRGVAADGVEIFAVLVSLNGGPFLPATITPGLLPNTVTWSIDLLPLNGFNTLLVKSVDNGGDTSKVRKIRFRYRTMRPEAGRYSGLITPTVNATNAFQQTGAFTISVGATSRFTGAVTLGGFAPLPIFGVVAPDGSVQFGKRRTAVFSIPLKNAAPLELSLNFTVDGQLLGHIAGTLTQGGGSALATLAEAELIYTASKLPIAPAIHVPISVLNPILERGRYTALFRSVDQGLPATDFPQGGGFAFVTVTAAGQVRLAGRLADGSPFAAAGPLTKENVLPLFFRPNGKFSAVTGRVTFQQVVSQSDADGALKWFKPASPKAAAYRAGWPTGIETDFVASKFIRYLPGDFTPLGNEPETSVPNATITLDHPSFATPLSNDLIVSGLGGVTVLTPPAGSNGATSLGLNISTSGAVGGTFLNPVTLKRSAFSGIVFQKTQTASGFFLAKPAGGGTLQSGSVEVGGN